MQALVYIFVFAAGAATAALAYFGLMFTPIEAALTGLVVVALAIVMLERTLRRRAEARLERGIEDLSRLLSTDAQAGQVLSQRINEMADQNSGARLDSLEADISVLGTVVQQVAEAVAVVEDSQANIERKLRGKTPPGEDDRMYSAVEQPVFASGQAGLTINDVQKAIRDGRLAYHAQPTVTLPQRRPYSYDFMPVIQLENGELAKILAVTQRSGAEPIQQRLERQMLDMAFTIIRNTRAGGDAPMLNIPLSRATLGDPALAEKFIEKLDTGRAIARAIRFILSEGQWQGLNAMERSALSAFVEKGAKISLAEVKSLRHDFAELETNGIGSIRLDATQFINEPESFTDYHSSDVASYVARFGIDLIISDISSEQQILALLDDGVRFAQGNHIARAGPLPASMVTALNDIIADKRPTRAQS